MSEIRTQTLGYPRIGEGRELKHATEAYWSGRITREELEEKASAIRKSNWKKQSEAGLDLIPVNDFSFYDQVLDMSCLLGNVPSRFHHDGGDVGLDLQFRMARGNREVDESCCDRAPEVACEMTKWFDTNYHYIVPEFTSATRFRISTDKVFREYEETRTMGIKAKPVLIGPLTYLLLGKSTETGFDRFSLLAEILPVYAEILTRLAESGAEWVQMDEPALAMDLTPEQRHMLSEAYRFLSQSVAGIKLMVASYFGELRENLETFVQLPVAGLHLDAVHGIAEIDQLLSQIPETVTISLGLINGRNIWRANLTAVRETIRVALGKIGSDRLILAPSCSLMHVPISLKLEKNLDPEIRSWLSFADEKLHELTALKEIMTSGDAMHDLLASDSAAQSRQLSSRVRDPAVIARLAAVRPSMFERSSAFQERRQAQREKLKLPLFPTTTIGSFPQSREVRRARSAFRKGKLGQDNYHAYLREQIGECVRFQEEVGLDMPVHGEFERNDMVEYFGEHLEGFTFTENGWVQSYGSRYVKPPVIHGDVSRSEPMTVLWSEFAASLTDLPMKGMLTGPITILQWSFCRDDQPRKDTAWQIALAIRDEVQDLEQAGLSAIQIDEPALREGLPLRKTDRAHYLDWAVKAFRLAASAAADATQIHTHMCYCEFNDIIRSIADLDADVITIETARSNLELLDAFTEFRYPNEIGPGVYDIHSPRIPHVDEMERFITKSAALLPVENLWVNPDCGLKTRQWEEVRPALRNMVEAARNLRTRFVEPEAVA